MEGVRVRPPLPTDAPALAALAGELGYPTSAEALLGRLAAIHPTDLRYRHMAFVNKKKKISGEIAQQRGGRLPRLPTRQVA